MGDSDYLPPAPSPFARDPHPSAPRRLGKWEILDPDRDPDRPKAMSFAEYEAAVMRDWQALLASDPAEDAVQAFLELHPAMVPGGSGDIGPAGHQGSEFSAVFRVPELKGAGPSYKPDFMWITHSTARITPILIEIEKPSKRWFQQNGRPTADFRDAHDQLNEWRSWFARDANRAAFRERFLFTSPYSRGPLEPQFVLIYGRRQEFDPGGGHAQPENLRDKRDSQRAADEEFRTFDSLRPHHFHSSSITVSMTAEGPLPFAFSPVYSTGTNVLDAARVLGDPAVAFQRSVMMTAERRAYLNKRWEYWRQVAIEIADGRRDNGPMGMGFE
jgi:Domain of unknown function (DUF4263)